MTKIKNLYKKIVHKMIVKYLISCGGAFHHDKYGINGRYVVLMSDIRYHAYQNLRTPNPVGQWAGSDFDGDILLKQIKHTL